MQTKKLIIFMAVLASTLVFSACAGGVPEQQYNDLVASANELQGKVSALQGDVAALTGEKQAAQSDHGWVLAEVDNGQMLALETTGGRIVPSSQMRYYAGWVFDSPRVYKEYQNLRDEYNARVEFINTLAGEVNRKIQEHSTLVNSYNSKYESSPNSTAAQVALAQLEQLEQDIEELRNVKRAQEDLGAAVQAQYEAIPRQVLG
ncbi:hypothetical protein ACFLYV_05235 [Chloroflexota bacterium]